MLPKKVGGSVSTRKQKKIPRLIWHKHAVIKFAENKKMKGSKAFLRYEKYCDSSNVEEAL